MNVLNGELRDVDQLAVKEAVSRSKAASRQGLPCGFERTPAKKAAPHAHGRLHVGKKAAF